MGQKIEILHKAPYREYKPKYVLKKLGLFGDTYGEEFESITQEQFDKID